jgi:hypothetical protein
MALKVVRGPENVRGVLNCRPSTAGNSLRCALCWPWNLPSVSSRLEPLKERPTDLLQSLPPCNAKTRAKRAHKISEYFSYFLRFRIARRYRSESASSTNAQMSVRRAQGNRRNLVLLPIHPSRCSLRMGLSKQPVHFHGGGQALKVDVGDFCPLSCSRILLRKWFLRWRRDH